MTIFVIYKCWSDQMIPIFDSRVRSVCGVSSAHNKATYLTWNDKDLFHLNVISRDGVGGKISMGPFNCLVMMGRMYLVFVWCLSTNNFGLLFFFYVVFWHEFEHSIAWLVKHNHTKGDPKTRTLKGAKN